MKILFTFICILFFSFSIAQRTIGLTQFSLTNTDGYVLFAPIPSKNTYLIDMCGRQVHEWTSNYRPALSCYLLGNGDLLRTGNVANPLFTDGGSGGVVERYDWSGNLLWSYLISDSTQCQHHDAIALPNGNILAIVWDRRTSADAIQNGKNPSAVNTYILSEKIVELQPVGNDSANIVWEWKVWDHLIQNYDSTKINYGAVSGHPELIDINFTTGPPNSRDWLHMNSLDYNQGLDQILISSHNFNEIWIIDHSTTTVEAATHTGGNSGMGGDLMYRWGNVQTYDRGTQSDQVFFGQHHATWIPPGYPDEGEIMVFNNGNGRPTFDYSSIDFILPPLDSTNHYPIGMSSVFMPVILSRTYVAPVPTDFYAANISGVYPMQDGSFIVCSGPDGIFFELDSAFNIVWKYINPVSNSGPMTQGTVPSNNPVFRCMFYPSSYSGFNGVQLIPGNEIEINPIVPSLCVIPGVDEVQLKNLEVFPNPVEGVVNLNRQLDKLNFEIIIYDVLGSEKIKIENQSRIDVSMLNSGIYFLCVIDENNLRAAKFIKQ